MDSMCHFVAKIPAPHDHSNMLRIHAGPRNPPVRQSLRAQNWNPVNLQYVVRGKVPQTIELQINSQYRKGNEEPFSDWRHFEQQGSWRFCYWELKMLVSLHGLLCSTWKFYHIFCLIFCDFLVPILTWANQRKWHFIFFLHEGQRAMVQKNTTQSHSILEPTQKVSASYDQCALRSDTPKLVVFNRGVTTYR